MKILDSSRVERVWHIDDYCCKDMNALFVSNIVYCKEKTGQVVMLMIKSGTIVLQYCPFCGEKIKKDD